MLKQTEKHRMPKDSKKLSTLQLSGLLLTLRSPAVEAPRALLGSLWSLQDEFHSASPPRYEPRSKLIAYAIGSIPLPVTMDEDD